MIDDWYYNANSGTQYQINIIDWQIIIMINSNIIIINVCEINDICIQIQSIKTIYCVILGTDSGQWRFSGRSALSSNMGNDADKVFNIYMYVHKEY